MGSVFVLILPFICEKFSLTWKHTLALFMKPQKHRMMIAVLQYSRNSNECIKTKSQCHIAIWHHLHKQAGTELSIRHHLSVCYILMYWPPKAGKPMLLRTLLFIWKNKLFTVWHFSFYFFFMMVILLLVIIIMLNFVFQKQTVINSKAILHLQSWVRWVIQTCCTLSVITV